MATESSTKSGKSTDSLPSLGKIYRIFSLFRHVITHLFDHPALQARLAHLPHTRISREGRTRRMSFAHASPNKKRTWRKSRSVALTSCERASHHRINVPTPALSACRRLVPSLTVGTKLADELLGALNDCLTTRL